jgi:hypothetical protein
MGPFPLAMCVGARGASEQARGPKTEQGDGRQQHRQAGDSGGRQHPPPRVDESPPMEPLGAEEDPRYLRRTRSYEQAKSALDEGLSTR